MNQAYEEEISLKELLSILIKRKKVILASFLIITFLSGVYSFFPAFEKEKEYEATSSISIIYNYEAPENPEEIGEGYIYYQDRLQNIMIPTIRGYAHSLSILRTIITELDIKNDKGEPIKANNLAEDIEILNQDGGNLLTITVKYKDEQLSADIANKIPEKLIQMAKANPELSNYQINIIDFAISNQTSASNKLLPVAIGMVLGLMIGIFLAFAKNYLSKKIQSPSQLKAIGFDVDMILKKPLESDIQNKIIALSKLSEANKIVVGVYDTNSSPLSYEFIELSKASAIEVQMMSYSTDEFLLKTKEVDLAIIIIEEEKADVKEIEELAKLILKYKINTSVIFIQN